MLNGQNYALHKQLGEFWQMIMGLLRFVKPHWFIYYQNWSITALCCFTEWDKIMRKSAFFSETSNGKN